MGEQDLVFLLVEDNEHDVLAVKRAWRANRIANDLKIVRDGQECLDYLNRRGRFSRSEALPDPDVILLNNKLPKLDGLQVLKKIREHKTFHHLPIVMFTATENEADQIKSYDLGVNAYIVKPMNFNQFSAIIRTLNKFWELAEIPQD